MTSPAACVSLSAVYKEATLLVSFSTNEVQNALRRLFSSPLAVTGETIWTVNIAYAILYC